MKELAPGIWRLKEFPSPAVNVILPGHGPAVSDIAGFERFVASLPA